MAGIVERLRETHDTAPASEDWRLCCEAADHIEWLIKEIDHTRNAVRLAIGRRLNIPWKYVLGSDVDAHIDFVKQEEEPKDSA